MRKKIVVLASILALLVPFVLIASADAANVFNLVSIKGGTPTKLLKLSKPVNNEISPVLIRNTGTTRPKIIATFASVPKSGTITGALTVTIQSFKDKRYVTVAGGVSIVLTGSKISSASTVGGMAYSGWDSNGTAVEGTFTPATGTISGSKRSITLDTDLLVGTLDDQIGPIGKTSGKYIYEIKLELTGATLKYLGAPFTTVDGVLKVE